MIGLALRAMGVQAGRALGWKSLVRPFIAHLTLTNRCNLRCAMCNMWAMTPKEDLTGPVLEKLRTSPLWGGIGILDLTGGEPFITDAAGAVQAILTRNIQSIYITTNGSMPERVLEQTEKILGSGGFRLFVGVSLDGPEEVHDRLRGVKGTYRHVVETMEGLARIARENQRLHASVKYTIMPENWQYVRETFKLAHSLGFGFTAKPHLLSGILGNTGDVEFTTDQVEAVKVQINEIDETIRKNPLRPFRLWRSVARHADRMFHQELIHYLNRYHLQGDTRGIYPCDSSFISVMVHCDGKVYSCPKLMKPLGDLRDQTLEAVWESEQALAVRKFIQSGACACFSQCDMMPSLLLRRKVWMAASLMSDWLRKT